MIVLEIVLSVIGGFFSKSLGGFDTLLHTLILFVIMDYITGIMKSIINHKLNSEVGFKGIFKKVLIFFVVSISVNLDTSFKITNLRHIVIVFYIINEAVSILENATKLGLPIPGKLKEILNNIDNEQQN